jgi:diguanylate cyclase (GGDEF) domain
MGQTIQLLDILYIKSCVTFSTLVLFYFLLSQDEPLGFESSIHKRIIYGVICGLVASYLDRETFKFSDSIYYSFEIVPLIICVFYVGLLSVLCAFTIKTLLTGIMIADNLFVFSMIFLICIFRPWRNNTPKMFLISILVIVIVRVIVVIPYLNSWEGVHMAITYQFVTLFCLLICYHTLRGHFGFISALFQEKKNSKTDFLTRTLNRMGFEDVINNNAGKQFGIAIMDIDHFKKINDTYGHAIGDDVLVCISDLIKKLLRDCDSIARFGGEEFVILIRDGNLKNCAECCERLMKTIEENTFTNLNGKGFNVTVSFGVAMYNNEKTLQENLVMVDEALYKAKNNGRNCIVCV